MTLRYKVSAMAADRTMVSFPSSKPFGLVIGPSDQGQMNRRNPFNYVHAHRRLGEGPMAAACTEL